MYRVHALRGACAGLFACFLLFRRSVWPFVAAGVIYVILWLLFLRAIAQHGILAAAPSPVELLIFDL
jgi:hypothetical protein